MSNRNILPGVFDIIPQDEQEPWRSSFLWQYVEAAIRETAGQFGYREVRTPILEKSELFLRGVGEGTDIVNKEMYSFEDRGGRSVCMRPEGTAAAMRAFIDSEMPNQGATHKLFYIGPMFRYERSQAGRYRQHHQFGIEAIGPALPEQDAEVIDLIYTLLRRLGIKGLTLQLNNLGSAESRSRFRDALTDYLDKYKGDLSDDSKKRLEINPLRILDSKDEKDKEITAGAPSILDFLEGEASQEFEQLQELLTLVGIPFVINDRLVRGLDYYNRTVFEITADVLGAHNSLVGGGRYDGLMKKLGGPDLPSFGFGCGLERVIQTLLKQEVSLPLPQAPAVYIIPLEAKARSRCFTLLHDLHDRGLDAQMDYSGRKLNKVMQHANQIKARYVLVIGETELNSGEAKLKMMETGDERLVSIDKIAALLDMEVKKQLLLSTWEPLSETFAGPEGQSLFLESLNQEFSKTKKATDNLQRAVEEISHLLEPNA